MGLTKRFAGLIGAALARYIVRRAVFALLVVFGVVVIVFFLSRIVPADPAGLWAGPHARAADLERAREELHLNDPPLVQFFSYVSDLLRGSLGTSIRTRYPVAQDLGEALPATVELILAAMVLAVIVGIPLGILGAVRRGRWTDHVTRVIAIGGVSMPSFWLAAIFFLIFVTALGILPPGSRLSVEVQLTNPMRSITGLLLFDALIQGNLPVLFDGLWHLVLPAVTLAAYPIGLVARMVRTMMVEVLGENYIRTARAYGIPDRVIHYRYALKNAIPPAIVALGLSLAYSLIGAFLIEGIFAWPGVGLYASTAILSFDYPAILGVSIVVSAFYVVVNLAVDLFQAFLDPRVVLGKREA